MSELLRKLLQLPEQASTFAAGIDGLHFVIITLTVLGTLGLGAAAISFMLGQRSGGEKAYQAPRGAARWLELSALSGLLCLFVGFWIVGYRQYLAMATPPAATLDVYVIAKQWMWSFAYARGGASNYDLYVPAGKPVRLLLTSRDVIHSFFVPAMRIKQDAIPGRMTNAWFQALRPGSYPILCAEYCGLSHARMRGRVVVLSAERYEAWQKSGFQAPELSAQEAPLIGDRAPAGAESMVDAGRRIASDRGCLRCHTLDGTPRLGPSFRGLYQSTVALSDGGQVRADAAYLTRAMMDPNAELRAGFEPIMPSYMGLLEAPEVAALVELIRSLRGPLPEAEGE